jgi:hypothetical protein
MPAPTKQLWGGIAGLVVVLLLLALRNRSNFPRPTNIRSARAEPGVFEPGHDHPSKRRAPPAFGSQGSGPQSSVNPYLHLSQEMAFDSQYARSGLTNLLLMLSLSDAIASGGDLSDEQLTTQLSAQGLDPQVIGERISNYPRGNTSLSALYARNESIPGFQEVRSALAGSVLEIDPSSECLLECFRFVACTSEMSDFLGGLQKSMSDGPGKDIYAPLVETLARDEQDLRWAFTRVFRDRFLLRYGLPEPQVDALMESLAGLTVHTATTQDLYLPRRRRD